MPTLQGQCKQCTVVWAEEGCKPVAQGRVRVNYAEGGLQNIIMVRIWHSRRYCNVVMRQEVGLQDLMQLLPGVQRLDEIKTYSFL